MSASQPEHGQAVPGVLHVVPANGGGVDRVVRDLCQWRPSDAIVHVTDTQHVLEWPGSGTFAPLDATWLSDLALGGRWGRPAAVHAHSTAAPVRQFCQTLCATTGAPCVLTLHDIGFAEPTVDPLEREHRLRFARSAAVRTAPSVYIVDLAQSVLVGIPCRLVENGVDPWPDAPSEADCAAGSKGAFAIAVIGAIGEHKGLDFLLEFAAHLPSTLRVVIIGYTAQQLLPGWALPGRIWMHGAFEPRDLPGLVRRYAVQWAFFPPGMPESYSFALSDAWQAGLPAAVPDHGALAERVRRHGGGCIYPLAEPAPVLAERVAQWVAAGRVRAPAAGSGALQSVHQMVAAMTAIYNEAGDGQSARGADHGTLRSLAQAQLDTRFFRKELLNLQGRLEAMDQQQQDRILHVQQLESALSRATQDATTLREQAAKLQLTLDEVQARLQTVEHERAALAAGQETLQAEHKALANRYGVLEGRHRRLTHRLSAPVHWLPAAWRDALISLGRRWLI
jgi:glycosyltransferase involved in cell wall biosynthesis